MVSSIDSSLVTSKPCLDCSTQIPLTATKCPVCLEWQVSEKRNWKRLYAWKAGEWILFLAGGTFFALICLFTYLRYTATEELRSRKQSFLSSASWNQIREVAIVNQDVPVLLEIEFDGLFRTGGTLTAQTTIAADQKEFLKCVSNFASRHSIVDIIDAESMKYETVYFEATRKLKLKFGAY